MLAPLSLSPLAPSSWHRHLARAAGFERNELSRSLDRARSRALVLAALGVAVAALLAAGTVLGAFHVFQRQASTRAAPLHRLEAVLLTPASTTARGTHALRAEAVWTYPVGQRNTGTIDVPSWGEPGSTATLWVDDAGRAATAPPDAADLVTRAVCAGLVVLGGLCLLVASLCGWRLGSLDRRADQAWQRSWALAEPRLSGRAHRGPGGTGTPHGTG